MSEPESANPGTADPPDPVGAPDPVPVVESKAGDRSPWNWLLFLPIVVPLATPLFNQDSPRLFGFPVFYWLQLAFILLGVTTTTVVYQLTKRRG
ncbi:DUF3311 domain-containing protein [Micromonospora sp. NBC_01699]|uniref:DUF3311 domain-containing protein n=1 Tax=Micromonospora sp. NBC_01699 TaxID=2975984 RepID=UPI002E2CE2AC|nr:DUF3311 domain-containing protein [Micromonospora sp. NBC_01699]